MSPYGSEPERSESQFSEVDSSLVFEFLELEDVIRRIPNHADRVKALDAIRDIKNRLSTMKEIHGQQLKTVQELTDALSANGKKVEVLGTKVKRIFDGPGRDAEELDYASPLDTVWVEDPELFTQFKFEFGDRDLSFHINENFDGIGRIEGYCASYKGDKRMWIEVKLPNGNMYMRWIELYDPAHIRETFNLYNGKELIRLWEWSPKASSHQRVDYNEVDRLNQALTFKYILKRLREAKEKK